MPTYLSPGVYVEEVSSGSAPIAGLGTSVAGFIGIFTPSDSASRSEYYINKISDELSDKERENEDPSRYKLKNYPVQTKKTSVTLKSNLSELFFGYFELKNNDTAQTSTIEFTSAPPQGCKITVDQEELEKLGDGKIKEFKLKKYPVKTNVADVDLQWAIPKSGFELQKDNTGKISKIIFTSAPPKETKININYFLISDSNTPIPEKDKGDGDGKKKEFDLSKYPVQLSVKVNDSDVQSGFTVKEKKIIFDEPLSVGTKIKIKYSVTSVSPDIEEEQEVTEIDENKQEFELSKYPVTLSVTLTLTSSVRAMSEGTDYSLENDITGKKSIIKFITSPPKVGDKITIDYFLGTSVSSNKIQLITNFTEFKQYFGDFTKDTNQNILVHAVNGFFRNGGTRAYVTWISDVNGLDEVLEKFEAIDEISIVAAPGQTNDNVLGDNVLGQIKDHAAKMGDRIAILDSQRDKDLGSETTPPMPNFTSNYAAFYFPWIQVYDPATEKNIFVPPSGHIAGVYAKVDGERGVHKAPANVRLLGALDLKFNTSKAKQDGLNPKGVNVIRKLNGNILVWGARTLGGDANGEFKYVNVRRHFCYLKDSIDKGTQWVVFEPNTPELWAKIRRNISAFLTLEWRKGALFGTTPQEAFYVKCDAENNPPALRDLGQVVIEIGVAVVKPAEFVIFRLSQWSGTKE